MSHRKLSHGRDAMQAVLVAAILACALGTSSCYGELQGLPDSVLGSTATSLELDPSNVNLAPNETVQFAAAILDQAGEPTVGQVDWTATGGAITANGVYTAGQTPGDYSVTATEASTGVSGSAGVTISDPGGGGGTRISGVTWACNDRIRDARGSDLWPITWADDDNQYTAWGDGNGFQGSTKVSWGIAQIAGPPTSYTATDRAEGPTGTSQGKIGSIISVGGTLYFLFGDQQDPGTVGIRKSIDKGQSLQPGFIWKTTDDTPMWGLRFIQHGKDNAYGGGYVYFITYDATGLADNPIYVARVREAQIEDRGAIEWFTSTDPNVPTWGARADRKVIFNGHYGGNDTYTGQNIVTYYPPTGEYVFTGTRSKDKMGEFFVYTAPNPWGPWTNIYDVTNWCSLTDTNDSLERPIAPKWIDGGQFWVIWSGVDAANGWDSFNLIEGTFQLR